MAPEVWFEPEKEEFNLYINNKEVKNGGKFKKIKWKQNQLELFKRFKEIKQDIWIQIYDVYLDKLENVIGYGVGGVFCILGIITMASHVYLKLPYPDWLIIGLVSTIIGFILVMTHTIFNFIIKLVKIKKEKNKENK